MKNTDNSREQSFGLKDAVFICFCLAASAACLFLFWRDLNVSLTRLDEKPVGVVTYKYRAAQRRFMERVLWERLREESPIYDGDTIRTADVSEATVSLFSGGGIIDLGENTLVRIQMEKTGTLIDLVDGGLFAAAQDSGLRIVSGGVTVDAVPGALVTAAVSDMAGAAGLDVQVLEGSAGIQKDGEQRTVSAGELYSAAAPAAVRVAVISPAPQAKFLNTGDGPLAVAFRWNRAGFSGDMRVRLDIAEDRGFTRIIESRESGGGEETLSLANGVYFWRAYPSSETMQGGASGKLTLVYAPPPALHSPRQGERFRFRTSRPGIRFQWQAREGAAAYLVEVSSSPDLTDTLFSATVQPAGGDMVSIVHSGIFAGEYYWRVTPVYPRDYAGTAQSSSIASFTIEQDTLLAAPQTQEQAETVYLEASRQDTYFTWKQEDDASYYTFLLSRQEDLGSPLIRKQERDNYFVFNAGEAGLAPGRYYWGVFQTDIEGNNSALSRTQTFVVMTGAPPERTAQAGIPVQPESAARLSAPPPEEAEPVTPPEPVSPAPERTAPETPPAAPPSASAPPPERITRTEAPPHPPGPPPERSASVMPPLPINPAPALPPPEQTARAETPPQPPGSAPERTAPETPPAPPPSAAVPPQRLSSPRNLRPVAGYVLTEEIILRDRQVAFSWDQVSGAAGYTFVLYQNEGGASREILRRTALRAPSFTLTDLAVLDAGEFVWQVEAESGGAGQRSEAATNRFRVNIGEIEASESRESGVMFGRD
jgi:hypothetical protein